MDAQNGENESGTCKGTFKKKKSNINGFKNKSSDKMNGKSISPSTTSPKSPNPFPESIPNIPSTTPKPLDYRSESKRRESENQNYPSGSTSRKKTKNSCIIRKSMLEVPPGTEDDVNETSPDEINNFPGNSSKDDNDESSWSSYSFKHPKEVVPPFYQSSRDHPPHTRKWWQSSNGNNSNDWLENRDGMENDNWSYNNYMNRHQSNTQNNYYSSHFQKSFHNNSYRFQRSHYKNNRHHSYYDGSLSSKVGDRNRNPHAQMHERSHSFSKHSPNYLSRHAHSSRNLLPVNKSISNTTKKVKRKEFDLKRPQSASAILSETPSSRVSKSSQKKRSDSKESQEELQSKLMFGAAERLRRSFLPNRNLQSGENISASHQIDGDNFLYQENAEDLSVKRNRGKNTNQNHIDNAQMGLEDISEEEDGECDLNKSRSPRKHHHSESAGSPQKIVSRRPRSKSSSSMNEVVSSGTSSLPQASESKARTSKLGQALVSKLLKMDKQSLKELVNEPKSRTAQFMVSNLMAEQRSALSQRLDELRAQNAVQEAEFIRESEKEDSTHKYPFDINADTGAEELQMLGHLEKVDIASLSSEIMSEVRTILCSEEDGSSSNCLPEVTISLDQLMSGEVTKQSSVNPSNESSHQLLDLKPSPNHSKKNENSPDSNKSENHLVKDLRTEVAKERSTEMSEKPVDCSVGNDKSASTDRECEIVSPPPKQSPAMITIDDTDDVKCANGAVKPTFKIPLPGLNVNERKVSPPDDQSPSSKELNRSSEDQNNTEEVKAVPVSAVENPIFPTVNNIGPSENQLMPPSNIPQSHHAQPPTVKDGPESPSDLTDALASMFSSTNIIETPVSLLSGNESSVAITSSTASNNTTHGVHSLIPNSLLSLPTSKTTEKTILKTSPSSQTSRPCVMMPPPMHLMPSAPLDSISHLHSNMSINLNAPIASITLPATMDEFRAPHPLTLPIQALGASAQNKNESPVDVKVKLERNSPQQPECHLCQHLPHLNHGTHHSPQCCPFTPDHLDQSPSVPPRPPNPKPPSASPMSAEMLQIIFNSSKSDHIGPYLRCENVNRPTSEERPPNPPPLSPSTFARPLVFPLPPEIPERPPVPLPLHHMSPRIKMERQTPLPYQCCCFRNECSRSVSRHSLESRNGAHNNNNLTNNQPLGSEDVAVVRHNTVQNATSIPNRIWFYTPPHTCANDVANPVDSVSEHRMLKRELATPNLNSFENISAPFVNLLQKGEETKTTLNVSVGVQTEAEEDEDSKAKITVDLNNSPNRNNRVGNSSNKQTDSRRFESTSNVPPPQCLPNVNNSRSLLNSIEEISRLDSSTENVIRELSNLDRKFEEMQKHRQLLTQQLSHLQTSKRDLLNNLVSEEVRAVNGAGRRSVPVMPLVFESTRSRENGTVRENNSDISTSSQETDRNTPALNKQINVKPRYSSSSTSYDSIDNSCSTAMDKSPRENDEPICNVTIEEIARVTRGRSKSLSESLDEMHEKTAECINADVSDTTIMMEKSANDNQMNITYKSVNESSQDKDCAIESIDQASCSTSDLPQKLFAACQSPKSRNSSGSDHCYSLRSRGPPVGNSRKSRNSESKECCVTIDEDFVQLPSSTDIEIENKEEVEGDNSSEEDLVEDDEKNNQSLSATSSIESTDVKGGSELNRHKRKRKTRKQSMSISAKRRRSNVSSSPEKRNISSPTYRRKTLEVEEENSNANLPQGSKKQKQSPTKKIKPQETEDLVLPPNQKEAILDMKIVSNYIFICASSCVSCYNLVTGELVTRYGSEEKLSAMCVVGSPLFDITRSDSEESEEDFTPFEIITGSCDGNVRIFNGQTASLITSRKFSGYIKSVVVSWKQIFTIADGAVHRWAYKSSKGAVVVDGCTEGIDFILCHKEGPRKVLLAGGKTVPLVIRDAFNGLFLRSLLLLQNTVYHALMSGGQLYTSGCRCIVQYEISSGRGRRAIVTDTDVCSMSATDTCLMATCYDSTVRVYDRKSGEILHKVKVDSSHKLLLCSAVYKDKIIIGNKGGDLIAVKISTEEKL